MGMRRVHWFLLGCLLLAGASVLSSCSEDAVSTKDDATAPETRFLYPAPEVGELFDVSDSLDIFVEAKDDNDLSRVEIWSTSENDGESGMIGSFDQPNGDEALPDTPHATEGALSLIHI
ncbi:MAG: hypothetical protein QUU85_01705 [Candidatus Eisenbacteria bacterium]|nr:hypothetical protein [Candidatus Eisenbacteria bacterium]